MIPRGDIKLLLELRRDVLLRRLLLCRENGRHIMARRYVAKIEEIDHLLGVLGLKDGE